MERQLVAHGFEPVYNEHSRVLLLGTMPSPQSRKNGFYYGHPQNRFWPVMAAVLEKELPQSVEEKRCFLLDNGIALWDVLAECEIAGADDGSIRAPVANDLSRVLLASAIRGIFATGKKAAALYGRCCQPLTGLPATVLPSTSPANAALGLRQLTEAYRVILTALH